MPPARDPSLLAKAARLYFVEDRSQDDIAAVLGTTRSNVSRMLKQARDLGIVEIRIVDPARRDHELERALRDRFPLVDARILEIAPDTDVLPGVGRLAVRWLDETLADGQVVALSWGQTLEAMVQAVDGLSRRDVEVVQLVGGLSALDSAASGQELVHELSERMGARHRYLHAPALFGSAEALAMLLRERTIAAALDTAKRADIAVVGIGTPGIGSSEALLTALGLTPEERAAFDAAKPVGDVCGRYYDLAGRAVGGVVSERVLAVTLDDLRAIPTVAGVAAGREKARGILGALHGRIIDVLVCDQAAARAVLSLDQDQAGHSLVAR
ncbi:MAG TPA: sugar-binding transcriptional regulator [Actinomycetes bacterium]|nr:sugar-binding transcriptional regulator [Actinomycetes bacterium]